MSQANTEKGRLVSHVWPHAVDVLQGDINRQDEHDDDAIHGHSSADLQFV